MWLIRRAGRRHSGFVRDVDDVGAFTYGVREQARRFHDIPAAQAALRARNRLVLEGERDPSRFDIVPAEEDRK